MLRKLIRLFVLLVVLAVGAVLAAGAWLGLPSAIAGFAAKAVCSGVFVAGRTEADVLSQDVRPASALLHLASVTVDPARSEVRGRMPASRERVAVHLGRLGCVLDPVPELAEQAAALRASGTPATPGSAPAVPTSARVAGTPALQAVLDEAFRNDGDAAGRNARAVVVMHDGRLVAERYGDGFTARTPQVGWSMSKTVLGLMVHARLAEQGIEPTVRALDWVAPRNQPDWLAAWRDDRRAAITVSDLLFMRDGLDHREGYAPWDAVPRMLWSVPDVAAFAGSAPAEVTAGERFRYLSATSNLLSGLLRRHLDDDPSYWRYPRQVLFDPIGADSAVLEADPTGTFIASSYLWATPRDWARIGQALMDDGLVDGRQVFAPGWLRFATNPPPSADPAAAGYGAHVWLPGRPQARSCPPESPLPEDALLMTGHFGQVVAMVPSQRAVIVRLGMTVDRRRFSRCDFIRDVLDALGRHPSG